MIDAYLKVLATDPTQAALILVATWVPLAFVAAGVLRAMAAIERRISAVLARRPKRRPQLGVVRPFMRRVLESGEAPAAVAPRVLIVRLVRLVVAIVLVVTMAVVTGNRVAALFSSTDGLPDQPPVAAR